MIEALIEGKVMPSEVAELAKGRLRGKKDLLKQAVVGQRSSRHRFLLKGILAPNSMVRSTFYRN